MSKVLTFSRTFPSYHPRKGEPTYFVEKILKGLSIPNYLARFDESNKGVDTVDFIRNFNYIEFGIKGHTIRAGHRFKVGDKFSPRVWGTDINPKNGRSGPYQSKQIIIAPDIEVKKVWDIGLRIRGDFKEFYCNDCDLTHTSIAALAKNDGLTTEDLFSWFNKPFDGQIICWDSSIIY